MEWVNFSHLVRLAAAYAVPPDACPGGVTATRSLVVGPTNRASAHRSQTDEGLAKGPES